MVFVNTYGIEQLECVNWEHCQNTTLSCTFWRAPPEQDRVANKDGIWHLVGAIIAK